MYYITLSECVHTHSPFRVSQQSRKLSRAACFYSPKFTDEKSDSKRSSNSPKFRQYQGRWDQIFYFKVLPRMAAFFFFFLIGVCLRFWLETKRFCCCWRKCLKAIAFTHWKYPAWFSRKGGLKSGWGITLQHSCHKRTTSFPNAIIVLKCKCEQVNTEFLLWAENFARLHFI